MSKKATEAQLETLIRFIAGNPGSTLTEIAAELGVGRGRTSGLIKQTRMALKTSDYNLVCVPQGHGLPWVYYFANSYDTSRVWRINRTGDAATRLETLQDVTASIVRATDPSTVEGRAIRRINRTLDYVQKELADLATIP